MSITKNVMSSGGNLQITTAATGTNYVTFASKAALQVTIINVSGAEIVWQQDNDGIDMPLPTGTAYTAYGLYNANQIKVKRRDNANTQVAIQVRWEN